MSVPTKCVNCAKVIIIGAGAAGIAAATRLYDNNIKDILILEAENRIGGRVYTQTFGDVTVELGAEYCHGEEGNVVYELANKYDLLQSMEDNFSLNYSSGEVIDQTRFEDLYCKLYEIYVNSTEEVNNNSISIGEYLKKRFNEELILDYNNNDIKELHIAKDIFSFFLDSVVSHDGAFSLFKVSAASDYEECEGNQELIWKNGGYKTIIDILLKKYPSPNEELSIASKILFNKEVSELNWELESNEHVIVKCSDGSTYTTDHVIFTPSLGVLKSAHSRLFYPPLPKVKLEAIKNLGIEGVSKIFLHFPEKWWHDEKSIRFNLVWKNEDKDLLVKEFPRGCLENGMSWLPRITEFISIKNSCVLVAWVTGEMVPEIENLPDDIIIDGIAHILKKFFSKRYPGITKPNAILRNNWCSNPHFRGTYSFQTPESRIERKSLHKVLAEPLIASNSKLAILFAGEATHPEHYSTVHGAIETGFREAQRIIDFRN